MTSGAEFTAWPPPPEVIEAWRDFAVARENPFVTPEWMEACVEELGERPRVVAWRDDDGAVAGVLPLVEAKRGRARTLRFPGARAGDLFEAACRPGAEAGLAAATASLLAADGGWQLLELDRVLGGEGLVEGLSRAWPGGGRPRPLWAERVEVFPYLELGEDGVDGWLAGRRRSVREDLRKRSRRLERAGAVVRVSGSEAELGRDFTRLERLHDARWGAESEALGDALSRLHRRFASAALRNGWLRLSIMELEGEAVAATYAWRLGDRYMLYISGYDPAYRSKGVGSGLMFATIRAAAEEGAAVYDLMRGDEEYKRRLETGRREAPSLLVGRPRSLGALSAELSERGREVARRLPAGPRSRAGSLYRRLARRR